jgi:thiamine pyrophosphate-dependent acetolactate synthase large subunit-like protein
MAIYPDSRFPVATERFQVKKLSGNYADVAQALGAYSARIDKPHDVIPAIRRALEVTRAGQPAVLEILIKEEGAASTFKFD